MKKNIMKIVMLMAFVGVLGFTACGKDVKTKKVEDTSIESEKKEKNTEEKKIVEENSQENKAATEENESTVFGKFTSQDIDGNQVDYTVFENYQLTMVNIWGTFCPPCIQEMPELGQMANEYADKMQIVGMIVDVSAPNNDSALKIIEHTKANYLHIITSPDLVDRFLGKVQVVPTTVFVDKNGNQVGDVYTGAKSKTEWMKIADELLATLPQN